MRVCQRNGWTLNQWRNLPEAEQVEWLAWDHYLRTELDDFRKRVVDQKAYDGATAALIVLAMNGIF